MAPPSIRSQFLRVHVTIGLVTALLITLSIGGIGYVGIRGMAIGELERMTLSIGNLFNATATDRTGHMLDAFVHYPGLNQLCIYDASSNVLAAWQAQAGNPCPHLIAKTGINTDGFTAHIARPIFLNDRYVGLVYTEATLDSLRRWCHAIGLIALGLFACSIGTSWLAARVAARCITRPLFAVRQQVECLKENDVGFCALPTRNVTSELADLSTSVTELRTHLATTTVPKESIRLLHNWHWDVLTGLLTGLRYRISADSPLLDDLSDYALLLQTERGDILPPPESFALRDVLNRSIKSAREAYPPDSRINLTASAQSHMPEQWLGHADIVAAIFRHLLLIGLKRTRKGFVCLRLEYAPSPGVSHPHRLHLHYEDSGPPLQQAQLNQQLSPRWDDAQGASVAHDISWLLVTRLIKRLGGTITGQSETEHGVALTGMLAMQIGDAPEQLQQRSIGPLPHRQHQLPLLLVVEPMRENRAAIARLLSTMHCQVILVENHSQAIELAPLLPIAAILLNARLAEQGDDTPRRLRHLMEDGAMPEIPLWVTLAKHSFIEFDYWRQRGINELLLLPLQPDILLRLCNALPAQDTHFYEAHDTGLRSEFSQTTQEAMPLMNRMLAEQIAAMEPMMESFTRNAPTPEVIHQTHAVKSAALTLGYYRLAGLMDQIEHAPQSQIFAAHPDNWRILMAILEASSFQTIPA